MRMHRVRERVSCDPSGTRLMDGLETWYLCVPSVQGKSGYSRAMKRLTFTREAIRRLDRLAAIEYHIPSIVLMENAAAAVARAAVGMVRAVPRPRIGGYCGPGDNGGGGRGGPPQTG